MTPLLQTTNCKLQTADTAGFTLLEICFALGILAVILGAALPNVFGWIKEQRLRAPARQLALLARTARLDAIEHQQPYQVIVRGDQMWIESLVPTPPPSSSPSNDTASLSNPEQQTNSTPQDLPEPYQVSDSTVILIQRWNENKMSRPVEWHWTFQPTGLCEPISVKFVQDKAELELDFDPLTATVAEEKYSIQ